MEEIQVVRTFLSRNVVAATYDDAFRRKILPFSKENRQERDAILASYDEKLAQLLGGEVPDKSPDSK